MWLKFLNALTNALLSGWISVIWDFIYYFSVTKAGKKNNKKDLLWVCSFPEIPAWSCNLLQNEKKKKKAFHGIWKPVSELRGRDLFLFCFALFCFVFHILNSRDRGAGRKRRVIYCSVLTSTSGVGSACRMPPECVRFISVLLFLCPLTLSHLLCNFWSLVCWFSFSYCF